jgi:hypothetical protein
VDNELVRGHAYHLRNLRRDMWQAGHAIWGRPRQVVAIYVGKLDKLYSDSRDWYGFEVRVQGSEQGTIFIDEQDVNEISFTDLGSYVRE